MGPEDDMFLLGALPIYRGRTAVKHHQSNRWGGRPSSFPVFSWKKHPNVVGSTNIPLPKTNSNITSKNRPGPRKKHSSSNHGFSGAFAVSFREGTPNEVSLLDVFPQIIKLKILLPSPQAYPTHNIEDTLG